MKKLTMIALTLLSLTFNGQEFDEMFTMGDTAKNGDITLYPLQNAAFVNGKDTVILEIYITAAKLEKGKYLPTVNGFWIKSTTSDFNSLQIIMGTCGILLTKGKTDDEGYSIFMVNNKNTGIDQLWDEIKVLRVNGNIFTPILESTNYFKIYLGGFKKIGFDWL